MPLNIGFFQYELSHPGNAPHVGMCLLLDDLRRGGHRVDAALVCAGEVDALIGRVRSRRYDFVALDSIFTVPVVRRLKEACPDTPILVGGTNALPLFLFSPIDYALVGPAREAMRAFAEAFERGHLPADVPNLYFRTADGRIDRTVATRAWALEPELTPFDPDLDWEYIGPERSPSANTRFASVVPELGCAFHGDSLAAPVYKALPRGQAGAALDELPTTPRARAGFQPFLENTRGCAFCAFRFQDYVVDSGARAADEAALQIRRLSERYGLREFSVQSENPFRFLPELIDRIRSERLPVDTLLLRTFPAMLARGHALVTAGISAAADAGIRLHLQQLGFENFVQAELDHLGKGITVSDNIAAARLLYELDRRFGETVRVFSGHGFILFTPWTRPEDVVENLRIVGEEAPFLAASLGLASRLCFYDPFNPIYRLAEAEGLAVRTDGDYGLDFRFADERTELMTRLALTLERELVREGETGGPGLSQAVMAAVAPLFTGDRASATSPADLFRTGAARSRENVRRDAPSPKRN